MFTRDVELVFLPSLSQKKIAHSSPNSKCCLQIQKEANQIGFEIVVRGPLSLPCGGKNNKKNLRFFFFFFFTDWGLGVEFTKRI